ncbi:hypothetical protein [Bradyrhizobium sp. SZCCHNR1075]|uniref:hypothetical protein n=1 Tax=Bradyrhizobium sp. SZCCHNR1075 TaxID=3057362 RepID=UPI0028E4F27E|nr:hypothetical protein [Bradyrhizobium sp. SZCCHNR1075]
MGAWRYCPKCWSGTDATDLREVIKGVQECGCGWTHHVEDHEREQAAVNLIERIERIEQHLGLPK